MPTPTNDYLTPRPNLSPAKVLIIVSQKVNYFYIVAGYRLAAALRHLQYEVEVRTLYTLEEKEYDWCLLMNTTELAADCENEADALGRLARLKRHCQTTVLVLLECATTHWFTQACQLAVEAGVEIILDLGLHSQRDQLPTELHLRYYFILNGLTHSEHYQAQAISANVTERPIPWAFIGHLTSERTNLAYRLVREWEPDGVIYLPSVTPVAEAGPHLNEQQFLAVLRKSRYQIWCSHHTSFYLEGERFRMSLLAGNVPIKIQLAQQNHTLQTSLFPYLIFNEATALEQLRSLDFYSLRDRFLEDFNHLPRLETSLAEILPTVA